MRSLRYGVAMSLDGYIAGPNGEYDWIPQDPDIDFMAIFARFDTLVMGRKTFELALQQNEYGTQPGMKTVVVSRTLRQSDHPHVTVVNDDVAQAIMTLKAAPGKDMWLFGGGGLFRSLLEMGLVDGVDIAVMPVLLGAGIPLLPGASHKTQLRLQKHRLYEKSGIVALEYEVEPIAAVVN